VFSIGYSLGILQVPGESLFPIEEAIKRGTIIMNLLSDAAQSATWPELKPLITKGKTLYFSHGFSVVYKEDVSSQRSVKARRGSWAGKNLVR
jgi:ketol-acid reductoisomerase